MLSTVLAVTAVLVASAEATSGHARALLLPDTEGHRLKLQPEALDWLRRIKGPVAVVTAIGQYRSGKSYLLNQLMSVPCDQGFGVGHKRETMTNHKQQTHNNNSNNKASSACFAAPIKP